MFSYPWLTAALLAGLVWNLATHAIVLQAIPADLWLVVVWLLGGVYLHATSSWRPLRLPAWLGMVLAAACLAAAVMAVLTASAAF